jgi:peptidoglycan L-alanyl-D-glutamate endopeptidase CwlK
MTPAARTARTLATLEPVFAAKIARVLEQMALSGSPMCAYDGLRTVAQQQALFAKGRTEPGKRVTNADGVTHRSRHQDGLAVDCAFVVDAEAGRWTLSWSGPWALYMRIGEGLGLVAGGSWTMHDYPHLEAPLRERQLT